MAYTALTIITDALVDIGVLADEETPTAAQAAGGLRKLNNMIESWNIESLLVYGSFPNVFPLVSNQGVYTLGAGGNFNIPRPNYIVYASVRDQSLPVAQRLDYPLYIYTDQEYAEVSLKGLTGSLPLGVYFDQTFPLINTYVFPVPSTGQYSLVIWTQGIIGELLLNDTIDLAAGYKRALTANLCEELAPSYGLEVPSSVQKMAIESKAALKLKNFQLNELSIDPKLTGRGFNYLTGDTI